MKNNMPPEAEMHRAALIYTLQIIAQFASGSTEMIAVGQRALGKGTAGFLLGACRQGICFVPVILFLPAVWGINGILYAQPIADVISAGISVCMALRLHGELYAAEQSA